MKIFSLVEILAGFSEDSELPVVSHVSEAQMVCEWVILGMYLLVYAFCGGIPRKLHLYFSWASQCPTYLSDGKVYRSNFRA